MPFYSYGHQLARSHKKMFPRQFGHMQSIPFSFSIKPSPWHSRSLKGLDPLIRARDVYYNDLQSTKKVHHIRSKPASLAYP